MATASGPSNSPAMRVISRLKPPAGPVSFQCRRSEDRSLSAPRRRSPRRSPPASRARVTSTLPRASSCGCAASAAVCAATVCTLSSACSSPRPAARRRHLSGPSSMIVVGLSPEPAMAPASREANVPLAPPSTASSRRSRLGTKPRASSSSRSRRCLSALRSGSRRNAQRSIGGIAMVVTTAIVTMSV